MEKRVMEKGGMSGGVGDVWGVAGEFAGAVLRGVGQVLLQGNVLSGVLMVAGLMVAGWEMGVLAVAGCVVGTLTGYVCGYERGAIRYGLYGFNGALVGVATGVLFVRGWVAIVVLVVGAVLSSVLARVLALQRWVPGYTAPFVLVMWLAVGVCGWLCPGVLVSGGAPVVAEGVDVVDGLLRGVGQVMLQGNVVTGFLFVAAVWVSSSRGVLFLLAGGVLSVGVAWLAGMDYGAINDGLAVYNGVLCAVALCDGGRWSWVWAMGAVVVSVVVQSVGMGCGVPVLTAPFVLVSWGAVVLREKVQRLKSKV